MNLVNAPCKIWRHSVLTGAAWLCLQGAAQAQPTQAAEPATQTVVITGSADASAGGLSKPYPGGQVARGGRIGLLGTQDVMDTPFAVTSYTQALLQDQQTRSVADALLNDPAVRNARGFGNFQEVYVLRGFPLYSDDMAYNGLYGLLPRQYVAAELLERVEVLRGASAFINGAAPGGSGLGGAINLVPKRAGNAALSQLTLGLESGGQTLVGLDLSRRFGEDRATGLRLNAVSRNGDTAIAGESRQLGLLAVGLDWRGSKARLSADLGWQDQRQNAPRPSVTPLGALPTAPAADRNFAQPWTYAAERQLFGSLRGEFDLAPDTLLWLAAGARQGSEDNRLANPSAAADGQGTAYRFDNRRQDRVLTGEIGLRSVLRSASVSHTLSASYSAFSIDSRNAYAFSDFAGFATDLYQPKAVPPPAANFFTGGVLDSPLLTQQTRTSSLALADTMALFDDRLRITLGLRQQRIEDRSFDYDSGAPAAAAYSQSRVTPMLGVLVKLNPALSIYGNAIDGLVKGDIAPAVSGGLPVTNKSQVFAPYQTHQLEAGAKVDLGRLGGTVSVFELRKPVGELVDNGNNTASFVVRDDQRHRGLELSVFGEASRGLKLLGGFSLIDARLSGSGNNSGKQAIGVARQQLNLGADWSPAAWPDLGLNARVIHTGPQWADAANTVAVPAWTRLDIGVSWATELMQRPLTLRARLDNVGNQAYWASAGGYPGANYLVLGAPRSLAVNATMDF